MSGLSISEIGSKQPWVNKTVTTLSYTIYKILEQAGIASSNDNNRDGVPDNLVTISQNTEYYNYKYCRPQGKTGFLAILGNKNELSYGELEGTNRWASKMFDFIVGGAYEIKEYVLMINWRIGAYDSWGTTGDDCGEIYFDYGNSSDPPQLYKAGPVCSQNNWHWEYGVRVTIKSFNLSTSEDYYARLRLHLWCSYSYERAVDVRAETYIVIVGVLK